MSRGLVAAAALLGVLAPFASARGTDRPVNIVPPSLSGAVVVGQKLTADSGPAFPDDYFGTHGDAAPSVLSRLAANGVGVERMDSNWISAEPNAPVAGKHTYQWAEQDNVVRRLAQNGMRFYPVLHHTPVWARVAPGDPASPPNDPSAYAAFAAASAARYGEGGTFWEENPSLQYLPIRHYEIWNEPNSPNFWNPSPRPSEYFSLYRAAQKAVHAVQPDAVVVAASLVDSRWRDAIAWLQELERQVPGALSTVDAVSIHPYLHNAAGIVGRIAALRQMLVENGAAAIPIEITEFGAPAAEVSLSQWASELTTAVRTLATSSCGISRLITYRDQDPHTGTGVVDKYGYYVMYDRAGTETALASAYFTGIADAKRMGRPCLVPIPPSDPPPAGEESAVPPPAGEESAVPPPAGEESAVPPPAGEESAVPPPAVVEPEASAGAAEAEEPAVVQQGAAPGEGTHPANPGRGDSLLRIMSFRVYARRVAARGSRRAPQAAEASRLTVSYRLSRKASVKFTIARQRAGRGWVTLGQGFTLAGGPSTRRFRFAERIAGHGLGRGRYRLIAVAHDTAGHRSAAAARSFRINGPAPKR